ncbi:S-adenosyl-L-methionine-dependent methyltransferase, partial [Mucor mucedo]|uniref:S-adenosyl-L-methionine-dependent methyltransferase n=1 Tax=Mucor mucedo TaxID=29922 RepID=UPI0022207CA1
MGGNISRDPPTGSRKKSGFRNNSTTASTTTTAVTTASANTEEKKVMIQKPTKRTIYGRAYHANEDSTYMLPRDDREIDRLHEEHFITKELLGFNIMSEALKVIDFQTGGLDILDVCCGPATWLCETSLEYPNCHFAGIDMCSLWPQVIRPVNLSFTEADVLQGLPYPDKSFDFIQMRFVVLAFKSNEWPFIISEIKRVLKDGGCFQCIELDMRITTSDTVVKSYTEAFESFCASFGLDASIGAKLDLLLTNDDGGGGTENELRILQSEYREIPLGWGGPIGDAYIQTFQGALDGLSPWLKQSLNITDHQDYESLMKKTTQALIQSKSFMGLYAFLLQKPL